MSPNKVFTSVIAIVLLALQTATAQELLQSLSANPAKIEAGSQTFLKNDLPPELPLALPFIEDFSYHGPYPDGRLWADSFAFVNTGFAVNPRTIGTATFDALNQYGSIYLQAKESPFQFSADFLTSHPIRLDSVFSPAPMALNPADNILLTFYFQPMGRSSAPRERDSLVVEFLHTPGHYIPDPDNEGSNIWQEDLWVSVWRIAGTTLNDFYENNENRWFKRVVIAVDDPVYFRSDFRFRFRNYASFPTAKTPANYAGNTSIWNVDYILLDYGRTATDPYYHDIAFAAPAQSILRQYQSIPWKHYIARPQDYLRVRFENYITNLDNVIHNYSYRYFIQDETGTTIRNYMGGTWNISPYHLDGYQQYEPHTNPLVINNPLPLTPAPARYFTLNHVIREGQSGDDLPRNDTIKFRQVFDNYFAYDDGVPESGYGLVGNQAKGAVRFILKQTDTLSSVKFFFNSTFNSQNQRNFRFKIWKNLDPEIVLYESAVVSTAFPEGLNTFAEYFLSTPLQVSDTIYVGWQQITNDFLNIGFDASNNAGEHIFYNTSGEWLPTIFTGALMIRPVFGNAYFTRVPEFEPRQAHVYPNPATGNILHISAGQIVPGQGILSIFDTSGRKLRELPAENQADIAGLPNGIYLLRATDLYGNILFTQKFVIAR